jgi:hypothetical protein
LLAVLAFACLVSVKASSHGEAPGVLANPPSDSTDLYAFRSYATGRSDYFTVLALYNPLQDPIAGPNYFPLSNDYYYDILIDTNGDGREEYLFTFDVTSELEKDGGLKVEVGLPGKKKKISIPLKVLGPINAALDDFSDVLNYIDQYTITYTAKGEGKSRKLKQVGSGKTVFTIPFDNAGEKTIPNYASYSSKYIYDIDLPKCEKHAKVFVGQRAEPFFIALGETFDLVNYQGNKLPLTTVLTNSKSNNDIAGFNIDAFALELPIECFISDKTDVVGVWTRTRSKQTGKQNQRMANPLINELIIGLQDKDKWNKVTPKDDDLFLDYFKFPAFAELLDALFHEAAGLARIAPSFFPRNDLLYTFNRGLPGINFLAKDGTFYAEMLRLNTSIAPRTRATQNNLGVIGGDNAGYPNGRRLGDDVVDITLRAVLGVLCTTPFAESFGCLPDTTPVATLPFGDGAAGDATDFLNVFPYLNLPYPGARL